MPNFTALDMSLPEVANLVAAMMRARPSVVVAPARANGRIRILLSRPHFFDERQCQLSCGSYDCRFVKTTE